ncbi:hypothetical protein COB52_06080 [Candidatus Kaiserbacteria bacterium]|nr:MAG: hypothetical protein COB52_06080 [Candidatus Kaiserbacteria bacterium]
MGTSIFQLQKEREFAIINEQNLYDKYFLGIKKLGIKVPIADEIFEPVPGKNHTICAVCREKFEDYIDHITSDTHKIKVNHCQGIYS